MPTTGQWIRQELIDAGDKGIVIADLHKKRKANWRELGITYKGGTYSSFAKLFNFLWQLGWVERTGETEVSHSKGGIVELSSPRTYYRITDEGLAHPELDWYDPISALHPEWTGSKRRQKYYLPTDKPRGRPRIGPPIVKKPPKPPKVKKPRVIKPPVVILSEKDKKRLIDDFVEVMGRRPTKAEIFTLFEEEVKLRQRKVKEEEEG